MKQEPGKSLYRRHQNFLMLKGSNSHRLRPTASVIGAKPNQFPQYQVGKHYCNPKQKQQAFVLAVNYLKQCRQQQLINHRPLGLYRYPVSNPLIVTDKGSKELPFVSRLATLLENSSIKSKLFCGISPNPRDDEIKAGCISYHKGSHDGIIAIGGGSALDGAKAIGMTVNSGVSLWDFEYRKPEPILQSLDCDTGPWRND